MRIPLPFPKCSKCGKTAERSFHKDCGGQLHIETTSDEVYCLKCNDHWNIWKSNYYCSCGNKFAARDVQKALTEVLVFCRVCAEEILAQQELKKQRITSSQSSLRIFLSEFLNGLGYSLGVALGTIIEAVSKIFK